MTASEQKLNGHAKFIPKLFLAKLQTIAKLAKLVVWDVKITLVLLCHGSALCRLFNNFSQMAADKELIGQGVLGTAFTST